MLLWLLCGSTALADPTDIYGFGGKSMGMGSGGIAIIQGESAVNLNPAAIEDKLVLFIGYAALRSSFAQPGDVAWDMDRNGLIDENDPAYSPPWHYPRADGISFGLVHPLHERIRVGLNLFVPTDRLLRLYSYDSSLPVWFMYQNRPYRYSAQFGAGIDLLKGMRLGVGTQLGYKGNYDISLLLTLDKKYSQS